MPTPFLPRRPLFIIDASDADADAVYDLRYY